MMSRFIPATSFSSDAAACSGCERAYGNAPELRLGPAMIQLNILTGNKAGTPWTTRRFPVKVGRSARNDLQVEEDGVWDQHLQITLDPAEGFTMETQAGALSSVNGQPVQGTVLRNGDIIEIGSAKMQFWMGEARQRGLYLREALSWAIVAAVSIGQLALIYWLIH